MSNSRQDTATPESVTLSPSTPPLTDESKLLVLTILEEIKNRKAGKVMTDDRLEYKLASREYNDLLQRLQGDGDHSLWGFVKHKLRYDYFPFINKFILRTPTPIRESVAKSVTEELQHQLSIISGKDGQSAEFAKQVKSDASNTIDFDDPHVGTHDPDGQFRHSMVNYPGVVLEVASSQKDNDLLLLAHEYLLGSDGEVRVMIAINLENGKANNATLSVWEPRVLFIDGEDVLAAVPVVDNENFHDGKGNPNESANINLQLQHFAMEPFAQRHGELHDPISISAQQLCGFLDRATGRVNVRQEEAGPSQHLDPGVGTKRPREGTSDENLEEQRKKGFQDDEEEKSDDDDSSYTSESSFVGSAE